MAESFRGFPASRNLGVPKRILIEEISSSMKNRQLLEGDLASIRQFGNRDLGVAPPARVGLRLQGCRCAAFLASRHIGEGTSWLRKTHRSLANGG
jgi:hypothetical protein